MKNQLSYGMLVASPFFADLGATEFQTGFDA